MRLWGILICLGLCGAARAADEAEPVTYPAGFFVPYNPVTARDMVLQVPGFRLDEGGTARGFGGTAGNVLIDGSRPSTKNDAAGDILGRIPASQVLRIDLIRGDTGGLNLRGQTVVANVILRPGALPASRWEARVRTTENTNTYNPFGSVSGTGYLGATRLTLGLETGEDRAQQARGNERLLTPGGPAELRYEVADSSGNNHAAHFNIETRLGTTVLHLNGRVGDARQTAFEDSARLALLPGFSSRTVLEGRQSDTDTVELGSDAEFTISETIAAKAIAVFNRNDDAIRATLRVNAPSGAFRSAANAAENTELEEFVTRLELDWRRWTGHTVETNLEFARNTLDSRAQLLQNEGLGPRPVPLPGGNTSIEEKRWEAELADTWQAGEFAVEAGLALESSTIAQRGDAERERSFTFLKPRLLLSYAPESSRQIRLRVQREVAQLDFDDFASSTNFADNQFALGNPDLQPANTWIAELTWERRFGEIGVAGLTLFHHWIADVQDIVPVGGIVEVPGNIGDGRRWGVEPTLTFSLDRLGLAGVRIDIRGRWQDSAVTDPVTGRQRYLSNEMRHEVRMDFRHNVPRTSWAWGGMIATASERSFFGLDEVVATDDIAGTVDMDVFVETTRWFGLRTRLQAGNIFNRTFLRDRAVSSGPRDLTPLAYRELRHRTRGHSLEVAVTGSF